ALAVRPSAGIWNNLGLALVEKGAAEEAIAAYREAARREPGYVEPRVGLGTLLMKADRPEEAVTPFRDVVRLRPDAQAYFNLGWALGGSGDLDGAIAAYREALRRDPDYAEAHCNLGSALCRQGKLTEALASLKRGHELGSRRPDWPNRTAEEVRLTEEMIRLDALLPGVLRGEVRPGPR